MTQFRRLGASDARVIGDALYGMAQADGEVDPREVEVIERFLKECAAAPTTAGARAFDGAALARATDGLHDSFICACAMLAFADGDFTAEEAVLLRRYAADVGVSDRHLEELVHLVEREQDVPPAPPPVASLMEVIGAWSREHLPSLREKVTRLFAAT